MLQLLAIGYLDPADKSYTWQKKGSEILKRLLPSHRNHSGVAHYIIHAVDYPPLAELGLQAARAYATIAPDSPHATATAANIWSMESLWRIHIAAELLLLICAVALLLILFALLRPVSRDLALLAVFFNLVSISLEGAITLHLIEALFPLGRAGYLKAFALEQLYAMASLSLKPHGLRLWSEPDLLRLFLRCYRLLDL